MQMNPNHAVDKGVVRGVVKGVVKAMKSSVAVPVS
jgi:hypothetical protein